MWCLLGSSPTCAFTCTKWAMAMIHWTTFNKSSIFMCSLLSQRRRGDRGEGCLRSHCAFPTVPAGRKAGRKRAERLGDFICWCISSLALFKGVVICLGWYLGVNLQLSNDCVRPFKLRRQGEETSKESRKMKAIQWLT